MRWCVNALHRKTASWAVATQNVCPASREMEWEWRQDSASAQSYRIDLESGPLTPGWRLYWVELVF
jgi:hypothetical protein